MLRATIRDCVNASERSVDVLADAGMPSGQAAMKCWTRREFGCAAAATCLAALRLRSARGQAKARIVVVGGGIGGATVAKYLALVSDKATACMIWLRRSSAR